MDNPDVQGSSTPTRPTPGSGLARDSLLAHVPGMVYRCQNDRAWTMLFVSGGCRALTGYGPEELMGAQQRPFASLIDPEDRERVWEETQAMLARGDAFDLTYRIRTPDGAVKWVWDQGRCVVGADGSALIEGCLSDVTARRRAEERLMESERRLRAILDHSVQFIGLLDPEGRMLVANQTSLNAVGVRAEQVVGRFFWDTPWWRHSRVDQERLRAAIAGAARGERVRFETTHVAADGRVLYIDFSIQPVRDPEGRIVALIPEGRDVSDRKRAEERLRTSEEKFAIAFHACPDAIVLVAGQSGRVVDCNEGFERILGWSREEAVGRTTVELGVWHRESERAAFYAMVARDGSARGFRALGRRRDGVLREQLISIEPAKIGGEEHYVVVIQDVSDQVAAEQALRDSEERFAKAFHASPDAITITDLNDHRIIDCNEGFERMFGYGRAEAIGRSSIELGLWENPAARTEVAARVRITGGVRDFRAVGRTRDGRRIECQLSLHLATIAGRACLIKVTRDITASVEAERALRESEQKFAKAFQAGPYALTITDVGTGQYLDVNQGFCVLSGRTREEVLGRNSLELGIWRNPADRERLIASLRRDGSIRGFEVDFVRKDGVYVHCRCSCEEIEIGGRACVVMVSEDVTAQREAERNRVVLENQIRQAQRLEALGQLAGGIAHDFNNILTGVMAYTELALMEAHRPAEVKKHLAEVRKAGERAKDLVRQILTFSRQQPPERRAVQLHGTVREAVKLLRSTLPRTLKVESDVESTTPVVLADPTQIHQVVLNLGTNAAYAMRDRPGRLRVELGAIEIAAGATGVPANLRPGRHVRLTVSDTGQGMSEEVRSRIFEPFFTTKAPGEGTGLGLSVVHGIVVDHEGAITVNSRVGEGTTFELFFPEHRAVSAPDQPADPHPARGRGQRILFIDDERMVTDVVERLLVRLGYTPAAFVDPEAALAAFERDPAAFDLVFTDLTMPGLTGIEVARRVRLRRPDVPIVLATGYSGNWTAENLRAMGIVALVPKPLTPDGLAEVVARALTGPAPANAG